MQPLQRPTKVSQILDRIGLRVLILALCFIWFYMLWGRPLQAIFAGLALTLLWNQVIVYGEKRTLAAREQALRRKIGGQLAVDSLMFQSALSAASNAATWISHAVPLDSFEQMKDGVLANSEGKRVYIECMRKHPGSKASRDDVLSAVRNGKAHNAEVVVLCATCSFAPDAIGYSDELTPRTRLLGRDGLIRLAGVSAPATNEQLQELGVQTRGKRFDIAAWKARILQPGKARRYLAYGLGMFLMLILTRQWIFAIPAAVCLALFIFSRRHKIGPLVL